jgi:hypothetical protein
VLPDSTIGVENDCSNRFDSIFCLMNSWNRWWIISSWAGVNAIVVSPDVDATLSSIVGVVFGSCPDDDDWDRVPLDISMYVYKTKRVLGLWSLRRLLFRYHVNAF